MPAPRKIPCSFSTTPAVAKVAGKLAKLNRKEGLLPDTVSAMAEKGLLHEINKPNNVIRLIKIGAIKNATAKITVPKSISK